MKIIFVAFLAIIALMPGVLGGGNSGCSSTIAQFNGLGSNVRELFIYMITTITNVDSFIVFDDLANSFIRGGATEIGQADIDTLHYFQDSGEAIARCIITYIKSL